jgi:hypothetical protein
MGGPFARRNITTPVPDRELLSMFGPGTAMLLLSTPSDNMKGVRRSPLDQDMDTSVNQETVNDTAKLMMHRLISRKIDRDPFLVERARLLHAQTAQRYAGRPFVQEWDDLLKLPSTKLRARLISRDSDMVRLRLSSPFLLVADVGFTDYDLRMRIRRAARRVAQRGAMRESRFTTSAP